jgi:hypothetical protein
MSDLPADREKALAAIAAGWGRRPTGAHPDCVCAKPMPEPTSPALHTISDPAVLAEWQAYWRAHRIFRNQGGTFRQQDCPVHRQSA